MTTTYRKERRDSFTELACATAPGFLACCYDGSAPISLSLNLADDVPPGDYDIISVLTYGNEVITKQSQAVQKIHVNSWVERHRFSIVVIGLIATLLALAIDIPVMDLPFVQDILIS